MSKNSIRIWIVCSALLALGIAPFLARGDQSTRQRIEQNRQAIANMTQSERDHLDRNFAAYKKKSPQQIAELTAFHQTIEKDQQANAGDLSKALKQYDQWLATIEPFQRDQLKEIGDPQERIRMMSEIVREQRSREVSSVFRRRFDDSMMASVPLLDREPLEVFMEKVEEMQLGKLSVQQKSDLNRRDGISRFLKLIEMLKENIQVPLQDRAKIPRWIDKELYVLFKDLTSQLGRLIVDDKVRDFLLEERPGPREMSTILRLQAVVMKSILFQVVSEENASSLPGQIQLEELFNSLPGDEQDALLQLEAIDFYRELVGRTAPKESEGNEVTRQYVFNVLKPYIDNPGGRPPGKRPQDDRDGRPRPGDGDRERGREDFRDDRGGPRRPFGREEGPPSRDERNERGDDRPPR